MRGRAVTRRAHLAVPFMDSVVVLDARGFSQSTRGFIGRRWKPLRPPPVIDWAHIWHHVKLGPVPCATSRPGELDCIVCDVRGNITKCPYLHSSGLNDKDWIMLYLRAREQCRSAND